MKITSFKKGLLSACLGSFWWGILGVFYFKHFSFVGHFELVIHRCLWTALVLILTTIYFSKWNLFLKTIKNSKNIFILFFTGILIFANWAIWLYALSTNQIIDASFGYFIMPILSVLFGTIFFKEKLNSKKATEIATSITDNIFCLLYGSLKNTIPKKTLSIGIIK